MMGDDPNIIDGRWASEQMNDDKHPATSSYWVTWSITRPLGAMFLMPILGLNNWRV